MSIVLFVVILLVLIVSHEFGHFIVAKLTGMRVDEFGIGFPPKIWGKKIGETVYSINWLPFGGFVSIFGENYEEEGHTQEEVAQDARSFQSRSKWAQAAVLLAGVAMNWLVAAIIIIAGFIYGLPVPVTEAPQVAEISNARLLVTQVLEDSAAHNAGLKPGDQLVYLLTDTDALQGDPIAPSAVADFVKEHASDEISIGYVRANEVTQMVQVQPAPLDGGDSPVLGIAMDVVGIAKLPLVSAVSEGLKTTALLTVAIVEGFGRLIVDAFKGQADVSAIAGPVGLVGLVGSASEIGMIYVLTLAAIISLNLAVLNLIPFPALDGGRLLFVVIEAIKGSPIPARFASLANMFGFAALIILMIVVTVFDVMRL